MDLPVNLGPEKALLEQAVEELGEFAFAADDDRGQNVEPAGLWQGQDLVGDLLDRLGLDLPAALIAIGRPHPGVEEAQVVVYLGHRAHGGAGIFGGGLLLDGDGRGKPLDGVHVGLVHLFQELPGVGGQRLDVAPLPLGVDSVKGQGRLARAGDAGDDDQPVPGQVQIDILEVVLPGALDDDLIYRHL